MRPGWRWPGRCQAILTGADLDNVAHGFMSLDSGVRPFAVDADGGFELCLARRGDLGQGCLGLSGEDRR
jgi:hypothetical protein